MKSTYQQLHDNAIVHPATGPLPEIPCRNLNAYQSLIEKHFRPLKNDRYQLIEDKYYAQLFKFTRKVRNTYSQRLNPTVPLS